MEKIKRNLKILSESIGVAGLENVASKKAYEMLKEYTDEVSIDHFYNVVGILKSKNPNAKTILLDAHIDEIGMIVTGIDEKGFVRFSNCGGIDRRLLSAQTVTIHGYNKDIKGVIGSKPPHLEKKEEADKIPPMEEMFIDIGYTKEQALEYISLGDKITVDSNFIEMMNNRVSCKALDDRAGVCVILHTLELLKGKDLPINVAALFSGQEEVGGHGAKVAGYTISPDYAIAIDVGFAKAPDIPEHRCCKMGEGAMIGYSAVLNKNFSDTLVSLAKENDIPYQYDVMGGRSTGTNADSLFTVKGGVKTSCISIPLRYMHTPIEQIQIEDIVSCAKLIAKFIENAGDLNV